MIMKTRRICSTLIFGSLVLLVFVCGWGSCESVTSSDLTVMIVSHGHSHYHSRRNQLFRNYIIDQTKGINVPEFIFTHEDSRTAAAGFMLIPILVQAEVKLKKKKWVFVCTEETRFSLKGLLQLLSSYDSSQFHFLGHALEDKENTIIHHFENPGMIQYPDLAAGFLISKPIVSRLISNVTEKADNKMDFRIDSMYELSKKILQVVDVKLVDIPAFCARGEDEGCVTWITENGLEPNCGFPLDINDIIFAVKTCSKFFKDRIPIVKRTWAKNAKNIIYFAEVDDPDIPAVNCGVENADSGHCEKLIRILKYIVSHPEYRPKKYVFIADDDTLLSVPRLLQLLACYVTDGEVALGERYGYMSWKGQGYDYITGGGGMVLSMSVVRRVVEVAQCRVFNDPDDMFLGMWLDQLQIPITHSPLFHQARPMDYAPDLLSHQRPISFHKFWACDPIEVYRTWLSEENEKMVGHDEL